MSESEKFWNRYADKYSKKKIRDENMYQRKLTETQTLLDKDMRILEFGCGTGTTAIHHAEHVQHIDAIDTSERMIEIAREKAKRAEARNINFTRCSLTEFGAATSSFDAVLGLNVIHLLPDRASVLDEVARVLKSGGLFISTTGCLGNSCLRLIKLLEPFGTAFGFMPPVSIFTETELVKEISAAGFQIENRWRHGIQGIEVFIVARKPDNNNAL